MSEIGFFMKPCAVVGGANGVCFERLVDSPCWSMTPASLHSFINDADSDDEGIRRAAQFEAEHQDILETAWQQQGKFLFQPGDSNDLEL